MYCILYCPLQVYCDMETDGGGWTVFQRRQDGSVDFYLNWIDYEEGFGNLSGEFWLGLDKIYRLTNILSPNILQVDLESFKGEKAFAKYSSFSVGSSVMNYTLTVSGYSGNASDGMAVHNGMMFTTKDRDNDIAGSVNCGIVYKSGWWFRSCYVDGCNLNGLYNNGSLDHHYSIHWLPWKDPDPLTFTKMMIRHN